MTYRNPAHAIREHRQERVENILFLTGVPGFLPYLENVRLNIFEEQSDDHYDRYQPGDSSLATQIEEFARRSDYIVIGNNLGSGLWRANLIPREMRADRACIVWNEFSQNDTLPYAALGYTRFLSRSDLSNHLRQYLEERYR